MPTELVTIYYNGHFTQMCYPEQVDTIISNYGLPMDDIEVVQYPAGSVVAPFNVGASKELYILKEEIPVDPPVLYSFESSLKEILSTSAGKKFKDRIRDNNKKLVDAGLEPVAIEPLEGETQEPVFYSITATIQPVGAP